MKNCLVSCHAESTRRFFRTANPLTIYQARTSEMSHGHAMDMFNRVKDGYSDINDVMDILGESFEITEYGADDAVLDYYLWAFEDEYSDVNGGFNLEDFNHKLQISWHGMRFSEFIKNNPNIRSIVWLAYAPSWL